MSLNLQNIAKIQKFQLENLVDFEKCCKTRIFLQKSVPIQPKTSNILPKFCRPPLGERRASAAPSPQPEETSESVGWQNFGRMLLVFGCIGSDFCKKICVLQHFSKSTRFSSWNFWNLAIFCKFCDICEILLNFHENCCFFKPIFAKILRLQRCKRTQIL